MYRGSVLRRQRDRNRMTFWRERVLSKRGNGFGIDFLAFAEGWL
jgi:hypothetical protein